MSEAAEQPMAAASLVAWRERLKLTVTEASRQLGISRQTLAVYERGEKPVPRYIALACKAILLGEPPLR